MRKTKKSKPSETPLMKQYNAIKGKYPGTLLLFRVGDFYETFREDAVKAAKILDIVLTKRANGAASHIELAGFPHHALDSYLPKLVRAGNRVAICDQLEDPKQVKGIVKRGVTELVTPGLSLHDHVLDQSKNNYLCSLHFSRQTTGIALLDLSTGEFMVSHGGQDYIDKLLVNFKPSEIIYAKPYRDHFQSRYHDDYSTFCLEEWIYSLDYGYDKLIHHFNTSNLKGFGIDEMAEAIIAAGAILFYLEDTEHNRLSHISSIARIENERYVWLDRFTIRNLELLEPQQGDGTSFLDVMDNTNTPMGARQLRKWVVMPLKESEFIEERLNIVESFFRDEPLRKAIGDHLKSIGDLERLVSKIATSRINPREFIQLNKNLSISKPIKTLLAASSNEGLQKLADRLNPCEKLIDQIEKKVKPEPPIVTNLGGIIKDGVDEELDELRKIAYSGKDYLIQIQQREIERTGIYSLKIAYNKVFGYYLEVTNVHKDKVPQDWIRKQTLVNAERYITDELKQYEDKILKAEDEIVLIEHRLYHELVAFSQDYIEPLQQNARIIAALDCYLCFANNALQCGYIKPELSAKKHITIKEGRHPVIEKMLPPGEKYIPNDIYLDNEKQQLLVITGPNMAGKSALLRQTALIVLMAQMGSFVPAAFAEVGVVDKIFTRVGASDNLSKGESTFMVEMTETASILNNLSDDSLLIMDEIGRGTSTYDGISIAWSIIEYLHNHHKFRPKTLFATHYHELNQLTNQLTRVKNFNVAVKELNDKVIFLRKLKEGGSEHSFGIHVAKMAGMPNEIVIRANEILGQLGKDNIGKNEIDMEKIPVQSVQMSLFESDPKFEKILSILKSTDVNTISPVEALLKLNEIKTILKGS